MNNPWHLTRGGRGTWRRLHEILARAAVVPLAVGILCCGVCALKDRLRRRGAQPSLRRRLAFSWMSFPLLLIACGAVSGVLLLGRKADQGWAMQAADFLRPTLFWQLAFWEWVGVVLLAAFLFLSVLWLPEQAPPPAPSFVRTRRFPEGARDGQISPVPAGARASCGDHPDTNRAYPTPPITSNPVKPSLASVIGAAQ